MISKFLRAGSKAVTSFRNPSKVITTFVSSKSGATTTPHVRIKSPAFHNNSNILKALHTTSVPTSSAIVSATSKYISPYSVSAPAKFMILCNRSPYAMQTAEEALKDAWPNMITIHIVEEGREYALGANLVVEVTKFNCIDHITQRLEIVAAKNPILRAALKAGEVAFYDVWAAQGENPDWARAVMAKGFKRIGASPDKMELLDKIALKRLCQKIGVPTAYFVELQADNELDKAMCLKLMTEEAIELYNSSPKLKGKKVFLKHVNGGGGRGSKESDAALMSDSAKLEEVITSIVNDTGGNVEGVYMEEALNFKGRRLQQWEFECDGPTRIEEEGRYVIFNPYYQKVGEYGLTRKASQQFISEETFDACRLAAKQLIEATGYDNRGTIEFLVSIDPKGNNEEFYVSEVNMRRQVEAPAIEGLVLDVAGRPRNTTAEQVMRSYGYPAPSAEDFRPSGVEIIAHMRLVCGDVSEEGLSFPNNVRIDGAFVPQGVNVSYVKGRVYPDGDVQRGRALIYAQTWPEACDKQAHFAQEFQFYGPNTINNYCQLYGKLALDSRFRAGELSCNETFSVLTNSPITKGKMQRIVEHLVFTITPLITNGYRPKDGIKNRSYPTELQFKEYRKLMKELMFQAAAETPFSRFLIHQDYAKFMDELENHLEQHGGGTVSVIRDAIQALKDQEAAAVQKSLTKVIETHGAKSGIIVGNEIGGAQFQAGEMRNFMFVAILLAGNPSNLPVHALLRTIFMSGLNIKSSAKQRFIAKTLHGILQNHYGWTSSDALLPWEPNNFHAGNHPQGDMTTGILLEENIPVVPNFAWDPRFTVAQFQGWVRRQIILFQEKDKPLRRIRIKNPGQGPQWNADVIERMINDILKIFEECGLQRPVIHIHNHNFDGNAVHIAVEVYRRCQKAGYRWLIIDSVPHGIISHNSNRILANAFTMTREEQEHLAAYNDGVNTILSLLSRFDNQDITSVIQDPNSRWAGGTNSSDIADAIKMGIDPKEIPTALNLAVELFGLGAVVTPFSEAQKQGVYAIYTNNQIQPKTSEAVYAYLKKGGKLAISDEILHWFSAWRTLLPRPDIIKQLLHNHGIPLHSNYDQIILDEALDIAADRKMLQALLPNTLVTDEILMTYYMFDKIGLAALQHRDHSKLAAGPRDMTVMMDDPAFVYGPTKKTGDSFMLEGKKITILKIQPNPDTGMMDIDFDLQGHIISTSGINPNAQETAATKQVRLLKDPKTESAAPMVSKLLMFAVKPGDKVKPGQTVAKVEAMKMEQQVRAPGDGGEDDLIVDSLHGAANDFVEKEQVLVTYRRS